MSRDRPSAPASLSGATYRYLRDTLAFDGAVMTDSLGAGAISSAGYSRPAAAAAAIEAGADRAMIDAASRPATLALLERVVANRALPMSHVNASGRRILAAKGTPPCPS